MKRLICSLLFTLFATADSMAVICWGGRNTTGEGAGEGWNYTGNTGNSGVYLGEYNGQHWVITANHAGGGNININGTVYNAIQGSHTTVTGVDLLLYRIDVPSGSDLEQLGNLNISSRTSDSGNTDPMDVIMVGCGGGSQSSEQTSWMVEKGEDGAAPWTWSTDLSSPGELYTGYTITDGRVKSWGTNIIEGFEYNIGGTNYFYTFIDPVAGEAQGTGGDSGGGVFYRNPDTGEIELVGLMTNIGGYPNQPGSTVVEGNMTFILPVGDYINEIYAIMGVAIPEPATSLFFLISGSFCLLRRERSLES